MTKQEIFETSDASTVKVTLWAWSFVLFLIVIAVGLWFSFHSSFEKSRADHTLLIETTFPSPRLRPDAGPWQTPDPAESAAIDETLKTAAKKNLIRLNFKRGEP